MQKTTVVYSLCLVYFVTRAKTPLVARRLLPENCQWPSKSDNSFAWNLNGFNLSLDFANHTFFLWVLLFKVDSYSRTNVDSIWAIGDVTNRINLTPVALMEGMAMAKTIFGNEPTKPDYRYSSSVPFTLYMWMPFENEWVVKHSDVVFRKYHAGWLLDLLRLLLLRCWFVVAGILLLRFSPNLPSQQWATLKKQ